MARVLSAGKSSNNALLFNTLFALIVVAIFTINIVYLFENKHETNAIQSISKTYQTINDNNAIYITLLEIERNHQYYILTSDNSYLNKMTDLIKNIHYQVGHFRNIHQTNTIPDMINSRIDSLNLLIKKKKNNNRLTANDYRMLEQTNNVPEKVNLFLATNNLTLLNKIKFISESTHKITNIPTYVILAISFIIILLQVIYQILINKLFDKNRKLSEEKITADLQLNYIIEGTTDLICSLDTNNNYVIFNNAYRKFIKNNFNEDIAIGLSNKDAMDTLWKKTLEGKKFEKEININDKILHVIAIPIFNNDHEIIGGTHIIKDMTPQIEKDLKISELHEKSEHELKELSVQNHKMQLLIELNDTMQACANIDEVVKAICSFSSRILDFSKSGYIFIMNSTTDTLEAKGNWGNSHCEDEHFAAENCWALRRGFLYFNKHEEDDLFCEHAKNAIIQNDSTICMPLAARNNILGLLHVRLDKSNKQLSESMRILVTYIAESAALSIANINLREKLNIQSTHDQLTGLYNRRYLDEYLVKQLNQARRSNVSLSIILFDIDFFKRFNDDYGHEIGDQMLKELGKMFSSIVRSADMACRYGGEEFIWVLYDCNTEQAIQRFSMLQNVIAKIDIKVGLQDIPSVTISGGIATFPEHSDVPNELIECADQALYRAKDSGRNTVISYEELKNSKETDK